MEDSSRPLWNAKFNFDLNFNSMKNNAELQKDVQDSIKWEPLLKAAEIGVTVKDGVVTLTGVVDNYTKKSEAEEAVKKVEKAGRITFDAPGIWAVDNELIVD